MDHRLALKQATLATLVAAVLFVPIVGLVLHDRALDLHAARVAVLLAAVFLWRYGLALLLHSRLRIALARRAALVAAPFAAPLAPLAAWLARRGKPLLAVVLAALVAAPFLPGATNYLIHVLSLTLIYVILGMGLNIVVGLAGLLDLGYVAFYAVGAYSYALLAQQLGLGFWSALPLVALLAGATGCALAFPVLRMHGDYLAIVTLGFGEIIRMLLVNMTWLTGGPNGISAPRPTLFGLSFSAEGEAGGPTFHGLLGIAYDPRHRYVYMYLLVLAIAAGAVWVFHRLRQMPMGRA
ncbi:MAG: branched-chain amino acid ABC transporter permease, partial [Candidatus Lambdaproteobacteria bacterium]|nr:branched-chain amino acid ABC transporter permease [Candidatus Lambdaproteobacteria bacterium]